MIAIVVDNQKYRNECRTETNMAAKLEMLICLELRHTIEMPMTNLGFLTKLCLTKVWPSNFDNDRHPEMEICLLWH